MKIYNLVAIFFLIGSFLALFSCNDPSNKKASNELPTIKDTINTTVSRANWRNPVMSPVGVGVARIVRGYFLVGDYKKCCSLLLFHLVTNPSK